MAEGANDQANQSRAMDALDPNKTVEEEHSCEEEEGNFTEEQKKEFAESLFLGFDKHRMVGEDEYAD